MRIDINLGNASYLPLSTNLKKSEKFKIINTLKQNSATKLGKAKFFS
jgi:hypothetical protein